jgi:hypothetical protein
MVSLATVEDSWSEQLPSCYILSFMGGDPLSSSCSSFSVAIQDIHEPNAITVGREISGAWEHETWKRAFLETIAAAYQIQWMPWTHAP